MTHSADGAPGASLTRLDTHRLTAGLGSGVYVAGSWRDGGVSFSIASRTTSSLPGWAVQTALTT